MLSLFLSIIDTDEHKIKFEDFYTKYERYVYKIAYDILGNNEDAETATIDTFWYFARRIAEIDTSNEYAIRGYIARTVKHRALNIIETRSAKPVILDISSFDNIAGSEDIAQKITSDEQYKRIFGIIERMPVKQRDIIMLKLVNSLKFKEIAQALNIPLSTVKSLYRRGIETIKKTEAEENG